MAIPKKPTNTTSQRSIHNFIAEATRKEISKYPITLALKPELVERIYAAAKELGMTRSGYIRFCVIQRLNKDE